MKRSKCGRFTKRFREDIGIPLSTCFPPDRPRVASTVPYAPFACYNHESGTVFLDTLTSIDFCFVEYRPIGHEPMVNLT